MSNLPDRAAARTPIRMRKMNCGPNEECGTCKKCDINADIKRRASLPEDHPDYALDDDETTGTMGIRDSAALRKNASDLHKGK